MTVFIINFLLIVMWDILLLKMNPTDGKKKVFSAIAAIQWILVSGLRSVDLSRDVSINYIRAFEETKIMSWSQIFDTIGEYLFNGLTVKDPGYSLLMKIFQIFSDDFQIFLVFIAVVFTASMAVWIYKYSSMPGLSFIIYSSLFYSFFALTGLRQTIATALIVFIGDKFIKERKFVPFAFLAFSCFLIHKSSVIFIPYYFVANIAITPVYLVIAFIIIGVLFVLGSNLYTPIAELLGFSEDAIEYDGGGANMYVFAIVTVCLASLILHKYIKSHREDVDCLYNLVLLTIATSLLVTQHHGFMRLQQYFALVIMIIIPEMVLTMQKKYRPMIYIGAVGFMFLYLIYNNPQYRFFWQ